jgi:Na+-driven multidrug efflux pump
VALSTLIAQLSILMVGIKILFSKKNSLRIELKHFKFDKQIIKDIVFLSIPIFIGKFLFSIGKVIINSMASAYGDDVFAAFGLAIRIPSVASSIAQTFEDSEVSIVSQNLGNNNIKRAFKTYNVSILYSLIVALPLIVLLTIFFKPLLYFFEPNIPTDVAIMTTKLFNWERFSALTSAMIGITANFFVCFKKSEISFILNITRIFVFRIPVLFLFQLLNVGYIALGLTMFISNLGTLIVGVVLLIIFYYKVKQYGYKGISYSGDPLVILS